MSTYTTANAKIFKQGLEDFAKKQATMFETALRNVAQMLVDRVDQLFTPMPPYAPGGNPSFPVWEGQMHDATGVGVYINGKLASYLPTKKGLYPQRDAKSGATNIIGSEYLMNALNAATTTFSKGIWIVLFSAVPYAAKVNTIGSPWGRGVGYFDQLCNKLYNDVCTSLKIV